MKQNLLSGVYPASLTPMHKDLSCNNEEFAKHCQDLIQRGCSGVVIFGTTGEGSSFTVNERELALKRLIELSLDPQKIILGISACALQDAIQLAQAAVNYHCAATLILPPFYYKNVSDDGVIAFYKNIIQSIADPKLKIILYHIPKYSGVPITINIIEKLLQEFPQNVVGIKESAGDLALTKEILAKFPNFKVFIGNETQITEAAKLGAAGAISGIANAYPELVCSLFNTSSTHDNKKIQFISQELKKYPLFPAIKFATELQKGPHWHTLRPPLIHLNPSESASLSHYLNTPF